MNKNMVSCIMLLILIFQSGYGQQEPGVDAQEDRGTQLSGTLLELISECIGTLPDQAQLSIAIIEDGDVLLYGVKKVKDSIMAIDNSGKVFEIGSITKVFTGTLLANLVLEDKLELDDTINDYLDFPLKDDVEITFRQLATHTSGLPRVPISLSSPTLSLENPYKEYGEDELKEYLTEKVTLNDAPGTKSAYSNLGFGLLGYTLSQICGTPYGELLQSRIFSKYHMNSSTTNRQDIQGMLVAGLNDSGQVVSNWDMAVHMGAGGILSSVEDLSKFAIAQFDSSNKELELTREKHFTFNDDYSTGLAWGLIRSEPGQIWDWHNGGTGGYTSSIILNTDTKNAVIILSNVSALGKLSAKITGLAPELMKSIE